VRSGRAYLLRIRDASVRIEEYCRVGREESFRTPHWRDAVIRQFEIIGEAGKRPLPDVRAGRPEVPWRRIRGLRDVLIHDSMSVDLETVWNVVQAGVPRLRDCVAGMLARD
jgi:uncharacterized protein with HEPN domain